MGEWDKLRSQHCNGPEVGQTVLRYLRSVKTIPIAAKMSMRESGKTCSLRCFWGSRSCVDCHAKVKNI